MPDTLVRPLDRSDKDWAEHLLDSGFGGRMQTRRGELIDALGGPGFVAEQEGRRVGLLTYRIGDKDAEIVFLEAAEQHRGIGTTLLDVFGAEAKERRVWLVTTNDNLEALRFYQRRGFVISCVRLGAMDDARRTLKPEIPEVGAFNIPIRDEIELEYVPTSRGASVPR
jgi:ribosomal protein S18 acetylase RimI-like enzyme